MAEVSVVQLERAIRIIFLGSSPHQNQTIMGVGRYDGFGDVTWHKERRFAYLFHMSPVGAKVQT